MATVELAIWAVLFFGLLVVAIYLDAKLGWHFTFLAETDIAFVVRGNELHKVLLGFKREDSSKIQENLDRREILWSDRESNLLAKWFGVHYVSILYPLFRLHEFEILAEGIKSGVPGRELPGEGALMRERLYREKRLVKALRWRFPRPFVIEEVELADRTTVDIIVMTILEVEDPYQSVFTFRGNLFETAAPFVKSGTIDLVVGEPRNLTYPQFVAMDKGRGSELSNELRRAINEVAAEDSEDFVRVLGVRANEAYVFDYGFSEGQKEVETASRERAVEEMKAEGAMARARGEAEARRINADAEALRFRVIAESIVGQGADPNVAADVARALVKYENIRDSKLTTWVDAEGGLAAVLGRRGGGA